ncbi:primase-helicase family protein [Croceicoccus sp. YJ47]|uniref:primase-helicase family protein n=1 Tax=Croceicoccus sp. YJ47 TaxID=2798724 RepID=UPI001921C7BE|nr:primase-helicase family protein [Croceicoccus sp. YJ47]QQN74711.1 hypothetical protein JD971_02935 [Croceicoccus sp. YJ47]
MSDVIPGAEPGPKAEGLSADTLPEAKLEEAVAHLARVRPGGLVALTAIPPDGGPTKTQTFGPGDEGAARQWLEDRTREGMNLYWTVNPTRGRIRSKAKKEDIENLDWIHVDIDPVDGADPAEARAAALTFLGDYKLQPTLTLDSGGGIQAFFRIEEPGLYIGCNLEVAEQAECYTRQLEAELAKMIAEDPELRALIRVDGTHDCCRLMRLPGTINRPNKKKRDAGREPRLASVVEYHPGRVYSLGDELTAAPPRNASPSAGQPTVQLEGDPPRLRDLDELPSAVTNRTRMLIVQGDDPDDPLRYNSRSEVTFAVCCELVRANCSNEQIALVLLDPDFGISAHTRAQKGALKYAERQIERARAEVEEPMLARLNADHAVIMSYGNACRVVSWQPSEVDPNRQEMVVQSFADFKNRYLNVRVQTGQTKEGNPVYSPAGKWWLEHPLRRQYRSVVFLPNEEVDDRFEYNLWRGLAVQPRAGEWPLLRELIEDVLAAGDRDAAKYLLNWAAYSVQHPERRAEVAIVLRGGKGTGKSTFGRLMSRIFGQHGTTIASSHTMTSNFNKPLHDCCLLFADEALARGESKAEGIIKSLITEPNIMIEPKGVDPFPSRNRLKVIIASNDEWVVSASADERRFAVFNVSPDKAFPPGSPETDERVQWWIKLNEEIDNGGLEAFLHDLMAMDLGNWHPRLDVPQTVALREQKIKTLKPMEEWLLDVIEAGIIPGQAPTGAELNVRSSNGRDRRDGLPGPQDTSERDRRDGCAGLYDLLRQSSPALRNVSDARLGAFLREWGFENYKHQQAGDYWRGWAFPPLADLRRRWRKAFGAWDFDEPEDGSEATWANAAPY